MRRRIDVHSPLADVAELINVEPVLGDRVERAHPHLAEALPMRRVGTERVRQVDEALRRERSIEAHQVRFGPRGGAMARGVSGGRRCLRCRPAGGLYREQRAGAYGHEREQSGKARAIRHGTPPADAPRSSIAGGRGAIKVIPACRARLARAASLFRYRDYFGSRRLCQLLFLTGYGRAAAEPWRTMCPSFMTKSMRRRLSVSASGSAGMAIRSAAAPTAIWPRSPATLSSLAASLVMLFSTSAGGTPAARQTAR